MPAPLAPLVGFVLGAVFAWWGSDELARYHSGSLPGSRLLLLVTVFSALVFTPVSAYFLAFETDWSFAYFLDTRRIPSALQLAIVLLDAASVPLGFVVAAGPARTRHLGTVLLVLLPPAVIVLGCLLRAAPRLAVHASYAQFHGDFGTRPIAGSSLGYGLLWMDALLALGVAWTNHQLRQLSRHRASPERAMSSPPP